MASIRIIAVDNRKDWLTFVKLPYHLYRKDPNWVPPLMMDQKTLLDPQKHPFYEHAETQFFLAVKDRHTVGRIAAIIDHIHNDVHGEKTGMFGFFECINDQEAADALLASARDWVRERGMTAFRGPLNPSQNEDCGLLVDSFDTPPVLMMTYNPPYYADLLENFGLKKAMNLFAYYIDDTQPPPEKMVRVTEKLRRKRNVTIRPVNMNNYWEDVQKVKYIYNNAWMQNWGFVPMTQKEFDHLAKNFKAIVKPELALLAEIDGKPVGFSLSVPNMNEALIHLKGRLFPLGLPRLLYYTKRISMIRIIIMGVIKKHRNHGIDAMMYLETWRNAVRLGYHKGEASWILETNTMMKRAMQMLGGRVYKTYRLYEIKI